MSTPLAERTRTQRSARPSGQTGTRRVGAVPAPRQPSGAVGRAYARRAGRVKRFTGEAATPGRSRFVLMVMALLGSGLVLSLWLSTTAAADSYRLDAARAATQALSERSETLRTEIASMQSAPELARAAERLGMVATGEVARLVANPDGSVRVVGTPKAAVAPAPPPVPAPVGPPPAQSGTPQLQPEQPGAAQGASPATGQAREPRGQSTPGQSPEQSNPVQPSPGQRSAEEQPLAAPDLAPNLDSASDSAPTNGADHRARAGQ